MKHLTDDGVIYEVEISQWEIDRRMATIIQALYPTFLELCASSRGAEKSEMVVGTVSQNNRIASVSNSQPRSRARMEVTQ